MSKKDYLKEEKITICGSEKDRNTWIYRLKDSGIFLREIEIEGVTKGEEVEIACIGDMHINAFDEVDEQNEELMDTKKYRMWNKDAASVESTIKSMKFCADFDQTVVLGDTLDFMSHGAMALMEKYVWNVDSEVMVAVGGHDVTREMQTGKPDKDSLEDRYAFLQEFWRHDLYYYSKVIKDRVLVVVMDDNFGRYVEKQYDLLKRDIELAREKGYTMLICQHEPIKSNNPKENPLIAIRGNDGTECYTYNNPNYTHFEDENTKRVYGLIVNNADVIKAVICGHRHGDYYSQIIASYEKDGKKISTILPQYILTANCYDDYAGHIMIVHIK